MRILVACEFSGIVRRAFAARGHYVVSVDLLPCEDGAPWGNPNSTIGQHYQGNVLDFLRMGKSGEMPTDWDILLAFAPCTFLCNSGVRWLYNGGRLENGCNAERWIAMQKAANFINTLWRAPIKRICLENPIMHRWGQVLCWDQKGDDTQHIQPFQFGHGETKATCLRLKGLPKLVPTNIVAGRKARVHHEAPSKDRWKNRSRTYQGIADAMAEQWGQS